MNIDLICKIVNGKLNKKKYGKRIINYFRIDSRLTTKNDCFITINEGYKYINNKMGLIITDKDIKLNIPIIKVENIIEALKLLAIYKRNNFKGSVIGITGSNGKTTTKELIYNILSSKYKVLKNEKNNNNHIGLPLTLCNLKDEEIIVLEMGMNHKGEIEYLSNICKPDIGIITNIGSAHIGNLGSKKNIYKAKMEILKGMNSNNLIVCGDNKYFKNTKYFKCGINKNNDLIAYNIKSDLEKLEFKINLDKEYNILFNNIGKQFIIDILYSIKIGLINNINIEEIIKIISNYKTIEHRMELVNLKKFKILDDSYNSSFESLKYDLDLLEKYDNKLLIIGSIKELGKYSKKVHKKIIKLLNKQNCEYILVGNEFKKNYYNNYNEVIECLKKYNFDNKIVLLKGSRLNNLDKLREYLIKTDLTN